MSQLVEKQTKSTGYPLAAGLMTITAGCLLIIFRLMVTTSYPSDYFLRLQLPELAVSLALDVLAVLGGALALTRTRLLFAVFGASVLIVPSLSTTAFMIGLQLMAEGKPTTSISEIFYLIIYPNALVLSTLSLVFLAKSKQEFT